jgi:hypothetical protein
MPRNIEIIQRQFGSDNPLPSIELADNALKLGGVEANSYALKTEVSEVDDTLEEHISDDVRHLVQSQIDKIDASINSTQAQTIAQSAVNTAKPTIEAEAVATAKTYTDSTATNTLNSANNYADGKDATNLQTAKDYADGKDTTTLNSAKSYTDTQIAGIDMSGKEDKSNKVTSISSSSTDTQYPSAKLLYDLIESHGIATLTSPVRIWDLSDGIYKLPEGCTVYYNGESDTTSFTTNGYLFIISYSSTGKYYYILSGYNQISLIRNGYVTSSSGSSQGFNVSNNYLTSISSFVKDNLAYSTAGTTYALSAYQGYVLDQKKAEKSEVDMITSNNTKTSTKSTTLNLTDSLNGLIKDTVLYGNTEQDGTPTPSNPVDVEVVTGDVTFNVTTGNMYNNEYEYDGYVLTAEGAVSAETGFIISKAIKIDSAKYISINWDYGQSGFDRKMRVGFFDQNFNFISRPYSSDNPYKLSPPNNAKFIKLSYDKRSLVNVQVIQGQSQLLSLGNIELAKIGDYQDYIYKNKTSGKWYKHKVTGKLVLDGSENWGYNSTGEYFYVNNATTNAVAWAGNPSTNGFCNRYKCASGWYVKNKQFDYGIGIADNQISVRNINYTDLATFKTDLANNNITVLYQKILATDEEITDTALLAQLNALYGMQTYKPITNVYTTTQNLNPELTIDYEAQQYIKNDVINQIWKGTQTEYDNLGTYSDTTLYLIEEE